MDAKNDYLEQAEEWLRRAYYVVTDPQEDRLYTLELRDYDYRPWHENGVRTEWLQRLDRHRHNDLSLLSQLDALMSALEKVEPETAKVLQEVAAAFQYYSDETNRTDDKGPDWEALSEQRRRTWLELTSESGAKPCPACGWMFSNAEAFDEHYERTHDYRNDECGPEVAVSHIARVERAAEQCLAAIRAALGLTASLRSGLKEADKTDELPPIVLEAVPSLPKRKAPGRKLLPYHDPLRDEYLRRRADGWWHNLLNYRAYVMCEWAKQNIPLKGKSVPSPRTVERWITKWDEEFERHNPTTN